MQTLIARLPAWVKTPLKRGRRLARQIIYYGNERFCPVCGNTSRRFRHYGVVRRDDAQCVHCNALERHRFLWLFLSRKTDLFDGRPKTVLHVAPEPSFEPKLRERLGDSYLTADLFRTDTMVTMDIQSIAYPDESFDVIYCSHVLEHVPDDRKAIGEFYRTLTRDGWAILLVPITAEKTFEDASITDPAERERVFGQDDHVRQYGPDYADRLREAGFKVSITRVEDLAEDGEVVRMGLTAGCGDIYFCTK